MFPILCMGSMMIQRHFAHSTSAALGTCSADSTETLEDGSVRNLWKGNLLSCAKNVKISEIDDCYIMFVP